MDANSGNVTRDQSDGENSSSVAESDYDQPARSKFETTLVQLRM